MSESELNDLKTILNSLVIPHPNGLSLRQLCHEYRDLEGQFIPYQNFGFSSVTALIKSMPDMIRMIGDLQEINSVVLYPVKNESTKHIIDLVQRQSKNRKRAGRRPLAPSYGSWRNPIISRPLSRSANIYRNDIHLTNDLLNALNNRLYNELFVALYQYYDALFKYDPSLNSEQKDSQQPLFYPNQNLSHFRPNVQNNTNNWRPIIPPNGSSILVSNGYNGGYQPKSVVDYSTPTPNPNPTPNVIPSVNSIGEKFLNFRITKTLTKFNEQLSKPTQNPQSRSTTDLNFVINKKVVSTSLSPLPSIEPNSIPSNSDISLPNEIKDNIKLMMSSPDIEEGFMLFNFEARYRHQFKEAFDYKKYGFQYLIDCLKTVPDLVEMIPTGTKTYKLMPTKNKPNNEYSLLKTTTVITNGNSTDVITSTPTTTTVTLVSTHTTKTSTIISTTPKKLFTFTVSPEKPKREEQPPIMSAFETPTLVDDSFDRKSISSFGSNDSNVNERAKQNFRSVLLFHENGLNALDFAAEYEKCLNAKFDSRFWGFKSAMELFYGLPHIFAIEVNDKNEILLHDSRFKKFEPKPKPKPQIDMNTKFLLRQIPDVIYARILKLVKNSGPLGLPLNEFMSTYEKNYESIDMTLRKLRISDVFHLFDIIKNEIPIVIRPIDEQSIVFFNPKEDLKEWTLRQTRAARFIIPATIVDTPTNVVLPGEQLPQIPLPEKFKPGNYEYVAVYISSAVNPHEMYIQFKGAEYHTALENLMFSLDFYETAPEEQWAVPYEFLCVGYPVICRYPGDKNWHRARICRTHNSDRRVVTVSFVDYGGTHVLDYKNLRLMKREFYSLPVQALKVGLYGIKPILGSKASDWTASARDKLLRFSKPQYALACTLIAVRPENHWVAICDTNTSMDVFLHLVLVNDKHAMEDMDQIDSQLKNENENDINSSNNEIAPTIAPTIAQTNGF